MRGAAKSLKRGQTFLKFFSKWSKWCHGFSAAMRWEHRMHCRFGRFQQNLRSPGVFGCACGRTGAQGDPVRGGLAGRRRDGWCAHDEHGRTPEGTWGDSEAATLHCHGTPSGISLYCTGQPDRRPGDVSHLWRVARYRCPSSLPAPTRLWSAWRCARGPGDRACLAAPVVSEGLPWATPRGLCHG